MRKMFSEKQIEKMAKIPGIENINGDITINTETGSISIDSGDDYIIFNSSMGIIGKDSGLYLADSPDENGVINISDEGVFINGNIINLGSPVSIVNNVLIEGYTIGNQDGDITFNDDGLVLRVSDYCYIKLTGLLSSDPHVAGALYKDSNGFLKISAGE